ncbi:hypothetical protein ACFQVD_23100 [Streptosporangium amethystogenes subsp. fukuiense]|uniref:Guanylate cyclase domain-containing protein n=1 Tax=Streptosporangium amethystogenes subsp. fukuiense TaxID=698418 RepID=A0ABW2T3M2_9ACTN
MNRLNRRGLLLGADVAGYGKGDSSRQFAVQGAFLQLVSEAAACARLDRDTWLRQPSGDGELAVIPDDGSEPQVVDDFVRHLNVLLGRHNEGTDPSFRLRLRVAVHFGMTSPAANGIAGKAVVEVSRMLDSAVLHEALQTTPDANLALMVSQRVYEDTVEYGLTTYAGDDFRQVTVRHKEFEQSAWIHVPRAAVEGPADAGPADPRGAAPRQVVVNQFWETVQADGSVIGISNNR